MKKPVTFRFDPHLLERARQSAEADHRSLTKFVDTALIRAIEQSGSAGMRSAQTDTEQPTG
jgi:hypothetical protein